MHSVLQRKSMGLRLLKILQVTHQVEEKGLKPGRQLPEPSYLPSLGQVLPQIRLDIEQITESLHLVLFSPDSPPWAHN